MLIDVSGGNHTRLDIAQCIAAIESYMIKTAIVTSQAKQESSILECESFFVAIVSSSYHNRATLEWFEDEMMAVKKDSPSIIKDCCCA